jgi:seryl-tRNA synthetase
MIDFNDLLTNPEKYRKASQDKRSAVDIDRLVEIGQSSRKAQQALEQVQAEVNKLNTEIKTAGKPSPEQLVKAKELKEQAKKLEAELKPLQEEFLPLLEKVPNLASADTPVGKDESENQVIRQWGKPRDFKAEGFEPKEHWELGEKLGVIDSERAAKVSGSRFAYLKGNLVKLQFALVQLALDKLSDPKFVNEIIAWKKLSIKDNPFVPVVPPVIINPEPFQKMARLEPREERYHLPQDDQFLVGSAEHTLGAMYMGETLPEADLPIRFIGYSTAFRREAGSYGKDMKGILRLHQFDKLEMEVFSTPETSIEEQELLVGVQEKFMQLLELPYQVVFVCTGDMGGPDARQMDIETWMPGQDKYRETHTSDLMTDYQARRLGTRIKRESGERVLAHMNDATAFAIGRTLIAIMENYQQADGSIAVPKILQPYVGFEFIR